MPSKSEQQASKEPPRPIAPAPTQIPLMGTPNPAPLQSVIKGGDPYRRAIVESDSTPPRNGRE